MSTTEKMSHLGIRVSDELNASIEAIAENEGITKSDVCRYMLQECASNYEDGEIPEHIEKDLSILNVKTRNNWQIKQLTLKSRVREFLETQLEKDIPPEPKKVRDMYLESVREEIIKAYPDYKDEYLDFLSKEHERYQILHPGEINKSEKLSKDEYDRAVKIVADNGAINRWDMAVEYAERLEENGRLPASKTVDDILQEARDLNRGDWRGEWEESLRANWPDEEVDEE